MISIECGRSNRTEQKIDIGRERENKTTIDSADVDVELFQSYGLIARLPFAARV